jgi:predicted ATP-grasp superfamily ATP-dependent carboligase
MQSIFGNGSWIGYTLVGAISGKHLILHPSTYLYGATYKHAPPPSLVHFIAREEAQQAK